MAAALRDGGRAVLKQLPQILTLAFPAMVLASLLTALLIHALAPASWSFWVSWLIGVISSATDPVAVVALLKELVRAATHSTAHVAHSA